MSGDPLGLTPDQREISDACRSGALSEKAARLLADMVMACPLCRAYECLPGCTSRLARGVPLIRMSAGAGSVVVAADRGA